MVLQAEVGTIAPPMTSLQFYTQVDASSRMALAPLHISITGWRQHQGLEAVCSAQSQDAAEGDEERGT